MSAQANPLPKVKAGSIREKWRAKTNYKSKRLTGYAPISFAMIAEIGRLSAGKATQLLYVTLASCLGQIVKPDQAFKESASDLRTADLAELCDCDERTVTRELGDLARRKIIAWDQSGKKGWNNITPLFRSWISLPDYQPAPVAEPDPDPEDEPVPEDPAAPNSTRTVITSKPVRCSPGKPSKPVKVSCGISAMQFQDDTGAEFSAVVTGGTLLVTRRSWKASDGVGGLKQSKDLDAVPRQGCRGNERDTGAKSKRKETRSQSSIPPVSPRAAELAALFDPLLLRSCGKSLSGDLVALRAACEAIGDVNSQFLVERVTERAERKISGPRAAVAICIEIAGNWQKVKNLPASQRGAAGKKPPTFAERLTARAYENFKKTGKIS